MFYSNERLFIPTKISSFIIGEYINRSLPASTVLCTDDVSYVLSYYCNKRNWWGIEASIRNINNSFSNKRVDYFIVTNLSKYTTNHENLEIINKTHKIECLNKDYVIYSKNSSNMSNWIGSRDTSNYKSINASFSNGINLVSYRIDTSIISQIHHIRISFLWEIHNNILSVDTNISNLTKKNPFNSYVWIALPHEGIYKKYPITMNVLTEADIKSEAIFLNQSIDIVSDLKNIRTTNGLMILGIQDENNNNLGITSNITYVDSKYNYLSIPYYIPVPNNESFLMKINLFINKLLKKYVDKNNLKESIIKENYGGYYVSEEKAQSDSSITYKINNIIRFSSEPGELWKIVREGFSSHENISPNLYKKLNEIKYSLVEKGYLIPSLITNNKDYPDRIDAHLKINYSINPTSTSSSEVLFDGLFLDNKKQFEWSGYSEKTTLEKNKWWNYSRNNSWPEGNMIDIIIQFDHVRFIDRIRLISGGNVGSNNYNYRLILLYTSENGYDYKLNNAIPIPSIDKNNIYYWLFNNVNETAKYLKLRIIGDDEIFYLIPNYVRLSEIEVWSLNDPFENSIDSFLCKEKTNVLKKPIWENKYCQAIKKSDWISALEYNIKLYKYGFIDWNSFDSKNSDIKLKMDVSGRYYLNKSIKYYNIKKYNNAFITYVNGKKYFFNYNCNQYAPIIDKGRSSKEILFGSILSNDTIPYSNYLKKKHPFSSVSPILSGDTPYTDINSKNIIYSYSNAPNLWNNPLSGSELIDGSVFQTKNQVCWDIGSSFYLFESSFSGPEPSVDIILNLKDTYILDEIRVVSQLITENYSADKIRFYVSCDGELFFPLESPEKYEEQASYGAKNVIFHLEYIGFKARYIKIKIVGKPTKRLVIGEVLVTGFRK